MPTKRTSFWDDLFIATVGAAALVGKGLQEELKKQDELKKNVIEAEYHIVEDEKLDSTRK